MAMIDGKIPRMTELKEWREEKFLSFFQFTEFFINQESDGYHFRCPQKKVDQILKTENPDWKEFNRRIGKLHSRGYYLKFANMVKGVGIFLRNNPSFVTKEIETRVKDNPKLNWLLSNYSVQKTATGQEIVAPQQYVQVTDKSTRAPAKNHEKLFLDSMLKVSDVFYQIASSIKPNEIKDMDIKDKIASLSKLSFILNISKNYKPNRVFQQFNIYASGREDLEKNILKYAQDNEEQASE